MELGLRRRPRTHFEGFVVSTPLRKVVIFEVHGLKFVAYKKKVARKTQEYLCKQLDKSCTELVDSREVIAHLRAIKKLKEEK
jgi:ribosomal protein S17